MNAMTVFTGRPSNGTLNAIVAPTYLAMTGKPAGVKVVQMAPSYRRHRRHGGNRRQVSSSAFHDWNAGAKLPPEQ